MMLDVTIASPTSLADRQVEPLHNPDSAQALLADASRRFARFGGLVESEFPRQRAVLAPFLEVVRAALAALVSADPSAKEEAGVVIERGQRALRDLDALLEAFSLQRGSRRASPLPLAGQAR